MSKNEEDKKSGLSAAEEEALFKFDDKTLDDYEEDALIDKGEYVLEVDNFKRGVKVLTEENMTDNDKSSGNQIGDKIPYATFVLRHKRDKNGKIEPNLMGRRYDDFHWDIRKESTRDALGQVYRALGFEGAYQPRYEKSEFIRGTGKDETRAFATYYIGRYNDSQTKRDRNSKPKIVNDTKTKKQEKKDAKGPVEL
jgi:hypothetical protein